MMMMMMQSRGLVSLLRGLAATVAVGLINVNHVAYASDTVDVTAYDSSDCTGEPVPGWDNRAFADSQDACQSLDLPDGTTAYGHLYCQDGEPFFDSCSDPDCTPDLCTGPEPLMPAGVCGTAQFSDQFTSSTVVCPDVSSGDSASSSNEPSPADSVTSSSSESSSSGDSVTSSSSDESSPADSETSSSTGPSPADSETSSSSEPTQTKTAEPTSTSSSAVRVNAYDTDDCTGEPVYTKDFVASQDKCQSYKLPDGSTAYGVVYCQGGQPEFNLCQSSQCTPASCEAQSLVPAGVCGNAFGVFASSTAVCVGADGIPQPVTGTAAASMSVSSSLVSIASVVVATLLL